MVTVMREGGESSDSLFRRFRKSVQKEKLLTYVRRNRFYEKPSQMRKRKAAKKRVKSRRTTMKVMRRRY